MSAAETDRTGDSAVEDEHFMAPSSSRATARVADDTAVGGADESVTTLNERVGASKNDETSEDEVG